MFTEYIYNVDGRKRSRFFESWQNAEKALLQDYKSILGNNEDTTVINNYTRFDGTRGHKEIMIITKDRFSFVCSCFTLSLVTCHFED